MLVGMDTPRPNGWRGGSDDFTFVRTFDGHITHNAHDDFSDAELDAEYCRNARTVGNADIGGEYPV